jgi:hypothetical protein
MYCFTTEKKTKATAKGIQRNKIEKLSMEQYKMALFGKTKEEIQQKVSFNSIRSVKHQINTIRITKTGLCGIDDKKFILNDNIHSLAHGHFEIKNLIKNI